MGNKLSPGCCCGCDIFRCDFDLRYVLPAIPADTSDWRNVWDVQSTGIDGTSRLIEIAPGFPGEGLIFSQAIENSNRSIRPVFPKHRQRTIPVYQAHPDTAPFAAFPNFNATYHYQILNPTESISTGFYRITANGRSGPFNTPPNLAAVIEPPWPTYWRRHFTLHDVNGEIDLPVDRFPFVLNPGEYLRSKKRMPSTWFGVNAIRAYHQSWMTGSVDAEAIIRFTADGNTIVGMRQTILDMTWGVRQNAIFEPNNIPPTIARHRNAGSASIPNFSEGRRGYWWLFRDQSVDVSESFDGTESFNDFDIVSLSQTITGGNSGTAPQDRSQSIINLRVAANPIPQTRIELSVDNYPQKLGTVTAGRLRADSVDFDVNETCPEIQTCPIIYPHTHVRWVVEELSIPGLTVPEPKAYTSVNCHRVCDLSAIYEDRALGSFEFPTQKMGTVFSRDATRTPRNLNLSFGPIAPAVGYYFDAQTPTPLANSSGGKVHVVIDKPIGTHPQVRIRCWFGTRYLTSFLSDAQLGTSIAWHGSWGNPFTDPFNSLNRPRIDVENEFGDDFSVDPDLWQPDDPASGFGWSVLRGKEFGLIVQVRLLMFWERLVDRWDGPLPQMEFRGTDHNFDTPFSMSTIPANAQSALYAQPQFIKVLTSSQQEITGYGGIGTPAAPLITTTATFETVDLSGLVLRIGPPVL